MVRRSAGWLLLPLALAFATAIGAQQLLFLGYDLRGLLERSHVAPMSPPPEGLAYMLDGQGSEWQATSAGFHASAGQRDDVRLGYEIADLVLLITPPTLARHRL